MAPIALDRPERGEEGEAERDERTGDGEHDEERLGVERVARGGRQALGQVVDELHLPGQGALDDVADLGCPLERLGRASGERGRVDLGLDLPLRADLCPGH